MLHILIFYELQKLNENLTGIRTELVKSNSKLFDGNTIITAIVGLLGVLVGAWIAYYFNKKLSDSTQKARVVIQRKNLIYSKIFKELNAIKSTISFLPDDIFVFSLRTSLVNTNFNRANTFYFDNNRYKTDSFEIWIDIKNDIRKEYIPKALFEKMEMLQQSIVNYFNSLENFQNKCLQIQGARRINPSLNFQTDYNTYIINRDSQTVESILEQLIKGRRFLDTPEIKKEIEADIQQILVSKERILASENYKKFKFQLTETLDYLSIIIRDIVIKYEYGESL